MPPEVYDAPEFELEDPPLCSPSSSTICLSLILRFKDLLDAFEDYFAKRLSKSESLDPRLLPEPILLLSEREIQFELGTIRNIVVFLADKSDKIARGVLRVVRRI